jgi:hypothetical protein
LYSTCGQAAGESIDGSLERVHASIVPVVTPADDPLVYTFSAGSQIPDDLKKTLILGDENRPCAVYAAAVNGCVQLIMHISTAYK